MDKQTAIEELKEFRYKTGISRDKCIDIYNSFKFDENLFKAAHLINGELIYVTRDEFWDYINTSDIRLVYSTGMSTKDINSEEFTEEITKLRKEKLRSSDKLRFERNMFNKDLRRINELEDLNKELIEGLKKLKPVIVENNSIALDNINNDDVLLVQLSDLHIQSITSEFREIPYDINTANKRLKKFANYIKKEIMLKNISKVVIATTGDMVGSDLIEPKRANQSCNKAVATIMCTVLLQYFILDLYSVCKNIIITGVSGNEDRWKSDFYTDDNLITNSADFIVLNMLELLLKDINGIRFIQGKYNERVVDINGNYILFHHGVVTGKGNLENSIDKMIARYSDKGINIRFNVFGHLHSCYLTDSFMRSGSLIGNDSYATNTLNLHSRASQNIAFIGKDGNIIPVAVDLQDVNNECYNISDEIKKFNIVSANKNTINEIIEKI